MAIGRFLAKVHKQEEYPGCWVWMGAKNRKGYGQFRYRGTLYIAPRWVVKFYKGQSITGKQVCHKCDNPSCVNPEHLFIGDNSINQKDSVAKGRHWNTRKTHCIKGHKFTAQNTYTPPGINERQCKVCKRNNQIVRRALYGRSDR